ncbi:DUF4136 domain-containing protein [Thalassomonas sp. M1454]|uniref:DUF4136 domain-containing protein n=1 Tax=Thalassomonas sp. M1454 TaxID=2594477 RepID=UPI00117E68E2|nr:DUF4136 domain-containing protein [Thalassomonas sp. M1454]TRX55773.1 DUF4136 domain-containing protein [Thalassomonas sp. M1454]
MKTIKHILLVLTITVTANACTSTSVTVDYDPETNFKQLSSYQMVATKEKNAEVDQLTADRIVAAIEAELDKKAINKASSDAAMQISYYTVLEQREKKSSFSIGIGGSNRSGSSSTGVGLGTTIPLDSNFNVYTQITIDIYQQDKLIWRGYDGFEAEQTISPQEKTQKINELVASILSQFPPAKK